MVMIAMVMVNGDGDVKCIGINSPFILGLARVLDDDSDDGGDNDDDDDDAIV